MLDNHRSTDIIKNNEDKINMDDETLIPSTEPVEEKEGDTK
jgi:hypothetical protein